MKIYEKMVKVGSVYENGSDTPTRLTFAGPSGLITVGVEEIDWEKTEWERIDDCLPCLLVIK